MQRLADKYIVRLPYGMRDRIRENAAANRRSMNSEIVHYLGQALGAQEAKSPASVGCGIPEKVVWVCLAELLAAGVYSVSDDGVIYSRRLIRDADKAERDKANGGKGGNPQLKGLVNPPHNQQSTGG